MSGATPRSWAPGVRRVVVKVGSRSLVDASNRLDVPRIEALVDQIARVRKDAQPRSVVLVSSGAIAAGLPDLGLAKRPKDLPSLQAAAAVGQARLVEIYRHLFAARAVAVAQVLLTHADVEERERHLNASNTLNRLLEGGVVPVVNENDTVAVDEIRFGDNDRLAAMVAGLVQAELTILLTTADGFYTRDPKKGGEKIERVDAITPEVRAMAGGAGDAVATGGMRTKLDAAEMVMRSGERLVIASAAEPDVLPRILAGEPLGTVFEPPRASKLRGRERWIAFYQRPCGTIRVDAGAAKALREKRTSLLPIGVRGVSGDFERGDTVSIVDDAGAEVARGLTNYALADVARIAGKKTSEIEAALGVREYDEVVHRDNMVVREGA